MSDLNDIIEQIKGPVGSCTDVSEEKIWSRHGTTIWQAQRLIGSPKFYPIYRYQDYYSYSLLALILLKGRFQLNRAALRKIPRAGLNYYSGADTIDIEIKRMGGPIKPRFVIRDPDEYAHRMADAMRKDIIPIEAANTGYTNIMLCGGKDSLNLSLLPWKNPVVVASAPPNYDLVKKFMTDNGLPFDVVGLRDDDTSLIDCEILTNCCRNNLEHCRWGPNLRELSKAFDGKIIFWKGQAGDQIMTAKWKIYTFKHRPYGRILKIFELSKGRGKYRFQKLLEKVRITQRLLFGYLWHRTAMWQGAHMSMLRDLTGALVLSGYHGPAVQNVVSQVDWKNAVQMDTRPLIGRHLHGRPVLYPTKNPGPPLSKIRDNLSGIEPFLKTLSSVNIPVST